MRKKNHFVGLLHRRAGRKGFTLIELLIVIAIILILIAIALPNFLEAQIRARVVKCQGELRSMGIAMDSYFLDFKTYPAEHEDDYRGRNEAGLFWLTSPISYISEIPEDPFANSGTTGQRRSYESGGIEEGVNMLQCVACTATWAIFSDGPDYAEQSGGGGITSDHPHYDDDATDNVLTYSPTNGSKSSGDIFIFGGDPYWIGVRMGSVNKKAYKAAGGSLDIGLTVNNKKYLHQLPPRN
ncbi:MAG: prepilin-type N-terminal cleavage/methylation domain-containing protein [Candidatus Omnitrophica bacterium]|nr:prepilin-type N-terminal cleavage/methylation domain-containing protein [Candidatus Omnitrophota bacterium]